MRITFPAVFCSDVSISTMPTRRTSPVMKTLPRLLDFSGRSESRILTVALT